MIKRLMKAEAETQTGQGQIEPLGFKDDERGSFIIFGLAVFMLMVLAGGIGVDVMRYETHRMKVQQTLDRSVLAAASLNQTIDPADVVVDYFARAGYSNLITTDDVDVQESHYARRVEASVEMKMPTTFLRLMYMNSMDVQARGGAEESAALTEISLVLDTSGSMSCMSGSTGNCSSIYEGPAQSGSRMAQLQQAAKRFVNIVMCDTDPSDPDNYTDCANNDGSISISVVPYSTNVLLGDTLAAEFNLSSEHTNSTCVHFDSFEYNSLPVTTTQALRRAGEFDFFTNNQNYGRSGHPYVPAEYYFPCKDDSWREVLPFEGSAQDVRNKIDSLQTQGATSTDMGIKWGAALLDPSTQPAMQALANANQIQSEFGERPMPFDHRGIQKVMVVMTDGLNTNLPYLHDAFRSGVSPIYKNSDDGRYSVYNANTDKYYWEHNNSWQDHPYGAGSTEQCGWNYSWWYGWQYSCNTIDEPGEAIQLTYPQLWTQRTVYWWNQFSWLPEAAANNSTFEKNVHMLGSDPEHNPAGICTAAKNAGIMLFTIGFDLQDGDPQHDVMRACASDDSYYFDVDGTGLNDAFATIAREITRLRLVY